MPLENTLGTAYNELGYNEHPATTSRFLCIKITACNVLSGTQCTVLLEILRYESQYGTVIADVNELL